MHSVASETHLQTDWLAWLQLIEAVICWGVTLKLQEANPRHGLTLIR